MDDVRKVNPKIIYARGSALGPRGLESDKGGYDMTAFWARAGTAASLTPPGTEGMVPPPAPAYGDTISGTNLAGGVAAALFRRERTGEPSTVDVSLLGSGLWAMGHGIALSLHLGKPLVAAQPGAHGSPANPLSGLYRTSDGRYLAFVMLQPARFWAGRVPPHRPSGACRRSSLRQHGTDRRQYRRRRQTAAGGARHPHPRGVDRAFRHPGGPVGSGPGLATGG